MSTKIADEPKNVEQLAAEYWEFRLRDEPLMATQVGDRRYDDKLPDITPEGRRKRDEKYKDIIDRGNALSQGPLSDADRLTLTALLVDAGSLLEYSQCRLEEWALDPLQGPQIEFSNVESYQPVATWEQGKAMVTRWNAMGPYFDSLIANLSRGLSEGKPPVAICTEKVIDELRQALAKPDSEWTMLRPAAVQHPDWSDEQRKEFGEGLAKAVRESVRPAFARFLQFLESKALPNARPQELAGIVHIRGGPEAYARLIRYHTSLRLTSEELHQTGLREVARINSELVELGDKVFGIRDRKEILQKLRTDPSLYFSTRDEVAQKAEEALDRARKAIPNWFGRLPETPCEVVRMEEHEEKHSTIAYYRGPAEDGSRPGRYYINTSEPQTRPRYEAMALAYHESIPGHHLQIAIAQELEGIPEFRKNSGVTAFIEGWGLYAERLADEMGLYSSDLDRIGVLSFDAWRACRLVVDTGMHARRWSRAQAIDFMLQNTALAKNNIVNEVDRYISWPGQALAYKTGQLEIMRLRQEAGRKLGSKFDAKKFHDVVLDNGAVPLRALDQLVRTYVAT